METLVQQGKVVYVGQQQLRWLAHRPGQRGRERHSWAWFPSRASIILNRTVELEVLPACARTASASSRGARFPAAC